MSLLQGSLDGPAGDAELPSDGLETFPGLEEGEDAIPMEDPRRPPEPLPLGAGTAEPGLIPLRHTVLPEDATRPALRDPPSPSHTPTTQRRLHP